MTEHDLADRYTPEEDGIQVVPLWRCHACEGLVRDREDHDTWCPARPDAAPAYDPNAHARTSDPVTSHVAAHALSDKTTMMRTLLTKYDRFQVRGLTADEATDLAGYTAADGAWKRVSDLKAHGFIEETTRTRLGRSGRPQRVCVITDEGREQLT